MVKILKSLALTFMIFYVCSADNIKRENLVSDIESSYFYFIKGLSAFKAHDYREAKKYFLKSQSNNFPYSYYYLGVMYEYGLGVENNIDKAIHYYKIISDYIPIKVKVITKDDSINSKEVHKKIIKNISSYYACIYNAKNNLAHIYADKAIKLKTAEKLVNEALKASPNDSDFLDTLGFIYYRQKRYNEAVKVITKSLYNDLDNITKRYHYALALTELNDNKNVKMQWEIINSISEKKRCLGEKFTEKELQIIEKIPSNIITNQPKKKGNKTPKTGPDSN